VLRRQWLAVHLPREKGELVHGLLDGNSPRDRYRFRIAAQVNVLAVIPDVDGCGLDPGALEDVFQAHPGVHRAADGSHFPLEAARRRTDSGATVSGALELELQGLVRISRLQLGEIERQRVAHFAVDREVPARQIAHRGPLGDETVVPDVMSTVRRYLVVEQAYRGLGVDGSIAQDDETLFPFDGEGFLALGEGRRDETGGAEAAERERFREKQRRRSRPDDAEDSPSTPPVEVEPEKRIGSLGIGGVELFETAPPFRHGSRLYVKPESRHDHVPLEAPLQGKPRVLEHVEHRAILRQHVGPELLEP
jgi:hypothetical protein